MQAGVLYLDLVPDHENRASLFKTVDPGLGATHRTCLHDDISPFYGFRRVPFGLRGLRKIGSSFFGKRESMEQSSTRAK